MLFWTLRGCFLKKKPQKPVQGQINGLEREQAKQLFLQATREQEDHRRSLEVYRTYQENIKTSSTLQTQILKGLKAGEDVYSLFLKAAKAISLMTSNTVFYSQNDREDPAIKGWAFFMWGEFCGHYELIVKL